MNETAKLKKVIIHSPQSEIISCIPLVPSGNPLFQTIPISSKIYLEHQIFKNELNKHGVETIELHDLVIRGLDIRQNSNGSFKKLVYGSTNSLTPLSPLKWLIFVRDGLTIIDDGAIIHNFYNFERSGERDIYDIARFGLSPKLQIVHDSKKEGHFSQGGDLIFPFKDVLLIGIGNCSDMEFAQSLGKIVDCEIYGIQMPDRRYFQELQEYFPDIGLVFLHLDTCLSIIGRNQALTIPFFFDNKFIESNPLYSIIVKLNNKQKMRKNNSNVVPYKILEKYLTILKSLGTVYRITNNGRMQQTNMKLVELLKELGMEIIYCETNEIKDKREQLYLALKELSFQGCNLLSIDENHILCNSSAIFTIKTLRDRGFHVIEFPGDELIKFRGGPHCLVAPVERG